MDFQALRRSCSALKDASRKPVPGKWRVLFSMGSALGLAALLYPVATASQSNGAQGGPTLQETQVNLPTGITSQGSPVSQGTRCGGLLLQPSTASVPVGHVGPDDQGVSSLGLGRSSGRGRSGASGAGVGSKVIHANSNGLANGSASAPVSPTSMGSALAGSSLNVQAPPLWYSGDTHEHIQRCPPLRSFPPGTVSHIPMDRTPENIYQECKDLNLNLSAISFWRPSYATESDFFNFYVPQVTGLEDPVTVGDPNFVLQYSVETSGFSISVRGHTLGLGISDGNFDPEADYPAPNLDFFNAQANTLSGYAHQAWPNGLTNPSGFVGSDYQCMPATGMDFPNVVLLWGAAAPVYAPIDAAFHKIDFLETVDMKLVVPGNISWTGMWYRLLKAGVPVQAVAGTDTNCFTTVTGEDPRTWVQIAADPLDHAKWLDGIRSGNYSMAMGPSVFMELQVDGQPAGAEIFLDASVSTTVQVSASVTAAAGVSLSDTIEILLDGDVVGTQSFSNLSGNTDTFTLDVTLLKSGWITARTTSFSAHTGFVDAYVDNKPIVDCASAEYFVLYAEYLEFFLDLAASQGMVEEYVGDSETEIRSYIQDGAEVFALHRAYDLPLPIGVSYAGKGTPSCEGPAGIVSRNPTMTAGTTVRFECFDGPTLGTGFLSVGANKVPGGYDQNGATVYVANDPSLIMYPIVVDDRGMAYADLPLPTAPGVELFAQFVFSSTPGCPTTTWTASEAVKIVTQ